MTARFAPQAAEVAEKAFQGIAGATLTLPVLEAMGQEVAGQIPRRYGVRAAGRNG